ncbi:hypothetical protein AB8E32_14825 [Marinomonas polaris]|uniref:hypothetical protein n=1 Tax=Marinomonas polaris TaxID=293552 RepID=UPI0035136C56
MISLENISSILDTSAISFSECQSLLLSDNWKVLNKNAFKRDLKGDVVIDDNGKRAFESKEFNIEKLYKGMSIEYELTIKMDLIYAFRSEDGVILGKPSTFSAYSYQYIIIKRAMEAQGFKYFKEINQNNIKDFCISLVKARVVEGKFHSLIVERSFISSLARIGNLLINANMIGLPDYPSVQIMPNDCYQFVEETVSERMNYKDWLKGGTLGDIPLEIAIVMLSEAIDYFESDELKRILALIKAASLASLRNKVPTRQLIGRAVSNFMKKDYRRDSGGVYLVIKHNPNSSKGAKTYRNHYKRGKDRSVLTYDVAEYYFNLCDEYRVSYIFDKKMYYLTDLTNAMRESLYRVSASLSILTGIRTSELASLREDSFEVVNERGTFKSKIKKTNNESETIRAVTIHAEPIAWIACELSQLGYIHGGDNPTPQLLKATAPWKDNDRTHIEALSWDKHKKVGISIFYNDLLSSLISGFDPSETPISSHRFRHTWAELAIRRFDGNVPEAIRSYFRHWYSSFMTMEYIRGKLKADLPEISRSYLRELIHRAAFDDQVFYGAAGRYMLSRLKEIDLVDLDQVDELMDEFDVLEVHEYSYCAIPKKFKSQAKCWDKNTQTPRYDEACWNNCGGCVGRLTLGNGVHKDEILRIGMSAQEIINTNNERGVGNLNRFWVKQLKQAESALNEFENRIPVVEIETEELL